MQGELDPNWNKDQYDANQLAQAITPVLENPQEREVQPIHSPWANRPLYEANDYSFTPSQAVDTANKINERQNFDALELQASRVHQSKVLSEIYAMNFGESGRKKADDTVEQHNLLMRKEYGEVWTDEDDAIYRTNYWKKQLDHARAIWDAPFEITNQNLINIIANPLFTPQDIESLGIAQEVREHNPMNSFTRSSELVKLQNDLKYNFFNTDNITLEQIQNTMQKSEMLYSYDEDSWLASGAGSFAQTMIDAPTNAWGNGLTALGTGALALVTALPTGGASVGWWLNATFALDMFKTTQRDIAFNAMVLDPSLTKSDALYDPSNLATSGGLAAANTFGFGYMVKGLSKAVGIGKKLDASVFSKVNSIGLAKTERNKLISQELINSAKVLGVSESLNTGIGGVTGLIQQIETNALGGRENLTEGAGSAALESAKFGAILGAMPLPAQSIHAIHSYHRYNKAIKSLDNKLSATAQQATIGSTSAVKDNATSAYSTLNEASGFNEQKVYIDIHDLREWGKEKTVDVDNTFVFGDKIKQAQKKGMTSIELSLDEVKAIKDQEYGFVIDELGRAQIDDFSPADIKQTLSKEEQARVAETIADARSHMDTDEKDRQEREHVLAEDMHNELANTNIAPDVVDQVVNFAVTIARSIEQEFGERINKELALYPFRARVFDHSLHVGDGAAKPTANLRGTYDDVNKVVRLDRNADAVTAIHEYSHYLLDTLFELARKHNEEGAPNQRLNDMLAEAFGADWQDRYFGRKLKDDKKLSVEEKTNLATSREAIQEQFVYQFLDYLCAVDPSASGGMPELLRSVKKIIERTERQRAGVLKRDGFQARKAFGVD